jgi:hypothetical protein
MIAAGLVYRRNLQVKHMRWDVDRHFPRAAVTGATGREGVVS